MRRDPITGEPCEVADTEKVELACKIIAETSMASLIDFSDSQIYQVIWIPKSQVDADSAIWKVGEEGIITISKWIAAKKGLI